MAGHMNDNDSSNKGDKADQTQLTATKLRKDKNIFQEKIITIIMTKKTKKKRKPDQTNDLVEISPKAYQSYYNI